MYIGIDLGTTNIKAALYDEDMHLLGRASAAAEYMRTGDLVEFDADEYFDALIRLLRDLTGGRTVRQLAFTGQAETLVCLGADGQPVMNAISWMDERSREECAYLAGRFPGDVVEGITGQRAVLPTWPATKILWLRNNRRDIFERTAKFVLLKDYIVYRMTGVLACDMSIATFSLYFDIYGKRWWSEMLSEIGITEERLPELVEPCGVAGELLPEVASALGIPAGAAVNIGTLDHFAGMIGTGNTSPGSLTLSTGTVMALATLAEEPVNRHSGIAMHYGFLPNTHIMLPVAESGGVSLEWFRNTCMPGADFADIDRIILERGGTDLLFLPYIVGTNAPEFDAGATGVFWGLRQEHDAYDMARAVMEGVAFVLRKNCDTIRNCGTALSSIIATGGGAKSPVWCQMQADITGLPVSVPAVNEAACLGAAMVAAVGDGRFANYQEAAEYCVRLKRMFCPEPDAGLEEKYARFRRLYELSLEIQKH